MCLQEDDGGQAWRYCGEDCPVTSECPPGWADLGSGCYQVLRVASGVDKEAAEAICRQSGARLVSRSSLGRSLDLLEYYRDTAAASDRGCDTPGLGYWLGEAEVGGQCEVWVPGAGLLSHVDTRVARLSCGLSSLHGGNTLLQPLCEKRPGGQGGSFGTKVMLMMMMMMLMMMMMMVRAECQWGHQHQLIPLIPGQGRR